MNVTYQLTPESIDALYRSALFDAPPTKDEVYNPQVCLIGHGVMGMTGFDTNKLLSIKPAVIDLLKQLPDSFRQGDSFLNMCVDRNGQLWTGVHVVCDLLLQMGLALDLIEYLLPREAWQALPGGMPGLRLRGEAL